MIACVQANVQAVSACVQANVQAVVACVHQVVHWHAYTRLCIGRIDIFAVNQHYGQQGFTDDMPDWDSMSPDKAGRACAMHCIVTETVMPCHLMKLLCHGEFTCDSMMYIYDVYL